MEDEPQEAQGTPVAPAIDPFFRIVRNNSLAEATEGTLTFGDKTIFTLEPPWRDNDKETSCIPNGSYPCVIAWSNRFNRLMPRLLNVPNRDGILIHPGNFAGETHGCILVGTLAVSGAVYSSQHAFMQFFDWLSKALKVGMVWCEITTHKDWSAV